MTPDQKKENYLGAMRKFRDAQAALHSTWTLETVKHLAIVNIAGIAGSTALLQVDNLPALPAKVAVTAFFAGLIFALIDFYLNSLGYDARSVDSDRAILATTQSETEGELLRYGIPNRAAGSRFFVLAGVTGWLSAILGLVGCVVVGVHLLGQ